MNPRRVVIAGGSGFLGLNLARHLTDLDYAVVVLSRHATQSDSRWQHVQWDARTVGAWVEQLEEASASLATTRLGANGHCTPLR